jgi:DNA-binding GntR family transcriptional regulator
LNDATRGCSQAPTSLSAQAYTEIEERIVTLVLRPGEVLSETALAGSLGIGRTPVREALQRLAREGLVEVLPRRGILVCAFNVQSQLRMLEVRREIERLMVKFASSRATPGQRDEFRTLAKSMRRTIEHRDNIGFMRLDRRFNDAVALVSCNEFASKAIALMGGLSRRFWFMHNARADDLPVAVECHALVADAIAAGDGMAAARASDRLLDYIEGVTRAAVDW